MKGHTIMEYPTHLIEAFKKLTDDFEAVIRADERDRIISKMRGKLFAEQTSPQRESVQQRIVVTPQERAKLPRSLARMLHVLQVRTYPVTLRTLAKECRTTPSAASKRLSDLRARGYVIVKGKTVGHKMANYSLASKQ
jgi:CRP-like cAMP-binding protein